MGDIYSQRAGNAPRRRGAGGVAYSPPGSLSWLTARMSARANAVPVVA